MALAHGFRSLAFLAVLLVASVPAGAALDTYTLKNHPDGALNPPPYGLRLDDLIDDARYTFDFEYVDATGKALMKLDYDGATIRIHGRAYGGKDTGSGYDAVQRGWVDIDFIYTRNVIRADNTAGTPGDDLYVIGAASLNAGIIRLDGWGGNATFPLFDKFSDDEGNSFRFDNDFDPRDPIAEADPLITSGAGWVDIPGVPSGGARDWLFQGEQDAPVSVESRSWAEIKTIYR